MDSRGNTIDFMLSENRDAPAAKHFFEKALTSPPNQLPRFVTVDKNSPAYPTAIQQLKDEYAINQETLLRQQKYLNKIIELNHRFIKKIIKPMLGYQVLQNCRENNRRNRSHAYDKERAGRMNAFDLPSLQLK
jgi:IS6 family transposase